MKARGNGRNFVLLATESSKPMSCPQSLSAELRKIKFLTVKHPDECRIRHQDVQRHNLTYRLSQGWAQVDCNNRWQFVLADD